MVSLNRDASQATMENLTKTSLLWGGSSEYLDLLYESYLVNSDSVPKSWRNFFDSLKSAANNLDVAHNPIKDYFKELARLPIGSVSTTVTAADSSLAHTYKKQLAVDKLVTAYRRFGHLQANLDPLNLMPKEDLPILNLDYYGLTPADLTSEFTTDGYLIADKAKLQDILAVLKQVYCGNIGFQYQYITVNDELVWLQERIESPGSRYGSFSLPNETKQHILRELTAAEGLEKYLHTRYIGQKRFSLEGAESLIVMISELIQRAGTHGFKEIVIAMAHRGRLNVLVNTLGKAPADLFAEFEGKAKNNFMSGDVKYHQGFSSDITTPNGAVHLALAFNPSHLEIVSPVAQGSVRARQERCNDEAHERVVAITIHGDSAFAGQGVVMETLNMSQLRGFSVGGTVRIIINNQVGFTTSDPKDTRSTKYCSDIAKMIEVPVLHVNSDDPEAVFWVTQLALDYRYKFKKDVIIDLVCYRRHGHNEADEPSATQPVMYNVIKNLETARTLYAQKLIAEQVITSQQDQELVTEYRNKLDHGDVVAANIISNHQASDSQKLPDTMLWHKYTNNKDMASQQLLEPLVVTGYDKNKLIQLGEQISTVPNGFVLQPQVKRIIDMRGQMSKGTAPLDWGYAELLAYASLLQSGYNLRLCGQDTGRGTFAHRHAILHEQNTGACYNPLDHISGDTVGKCTIIDSILSEEAVVAFEYGYSTTSPNTLVIWEAQFGDFVNGAQVVIDQFISSGEQKWGRMSGLVMLLPHGYEGMGPEHSSARLERFLQLCAQHNMHVCVPTTPSQLFHMLRRQMLCDYRKPLIVMSPKGFLRHKLAVSSLSDLSLGYFELVINEYNKNVVAACVKKVVLCSGKVYYDLVTERDSNNITDVAIIRIEQLYPFPEQQLSSILSGYKNAKKVVWCQEEPKNQGAWYCMLHHLVASLSKWQNLEFAGREASSAPAVGYHSLHMQQQTSLVKQAIY